MFIDDGGRGRGVVCGGIVDDGSVVCHVIGDYGVWYV